MFAYKPIDWNKGVKECDGKDEKFKELLEDFEQFTFYGIMRQLYENVLEFDLEKIGTNANQLKRLFG